ncbi:MAG TPA: chemotaxis protein CheW [Opitutaceae bacterium]|jgi:purine-binding chemotaxis protein CheW
MTASDSQILRERARALARPPPPPRPRDDLEVLEFSLASERYAVATSHVVEALVLKDLTPLPSAPAFVVGIINARGRILPVYDLKKFFGLPEEGITDLHRTVVVRGHGLELGLLADAVTGVRTVAAADLQPALPTLTGVRADYLKGVAAGPLVVLDIDRILQDPAILVQQESES